MKNLHILVAAIMAIMFSAGTVAAQEKEKEIKVKVVKEENGERTVIDTTFKVGEYNIDEINEMLNEQGLEDLDIQIEELSGMMKDVDVEVTEDGGKQIMIVKKVSKEGDENEKEMVYTVMMTDSLDDGKHVKMKVAEGSYTYIITDDEEGITIDELGNEQKMVMFMDEDGKKTELIIGSDDLEWVGENQTQVEVIESGDGKKVIVKNEDGTTREYDLPDEKGTYVIGEDGEIKKMDKDVIWTEKGEGMKQITVSVDDDHKAMIIMDDGETIELKDVDSEAGLIFVHDGESKGEQEVYVEVIKKKDGDKVVVVKNKIIVESVGDKDAETLEKSGVKINPDEGEKLEVGKLSFHPNPSEGKFSLEFTTSDKSDVTVTIYDVNGRKVYEEKVSDFDGHFKKDIDISSEKKGAYFLKIAQGGKISSKKIILE